MQTDAFTPHIRPQFNSESLEFVYLTVNEAKHGSIPWMDGPSQNTISLTYSELIGSIVKRLSQLPVEQ